MVYDLCPDQFVKDARVFVEQLAKVDYINLFVNCLADERCAEAEFLLKGREEPAQAQEGKVNRVCSLLIETMTQISSGKLLLAIITCHTKTSPPALDKVLAMIKELKAREIAEQDAAKKLPPVAPHIDPNRPKKKADVSADEALEFTSWLVKADKLYDIALQTYDINMVLQVAKHTQKDPKEYLPYLKSLQALEPVYRKYQIQKDLKQYPLALAELSQAPEDSYVEEALELVQKHQLYEQGLKLYEARPKTRGRIALAYADQLAKTNRHELAASMYRLAGALDKALDCYKKSENWPLARTIAMLMHWTPEKVKELAEEFLGVCRTGDDYRGMVTIMLDLYKSKDLAGKDAVEELIGVLVKARDYFKAIELAAENGREDLIAGEIRKGVMLAKDILWNDLAAAITGFTEKRKRLLVVQEKKRTLPTLSEESLIPSGLDFDARSESGRSKSSRTSKRSKSGSGESRRRAIKAKAVIKEGSRYEEEQLIDFLESMTPSAETAKDAEYVRKCLDFYGCSEDSAKLAAMLKDLQTLTSSPVLSLEQQKFAEANQTFFELFPKLKPKQAH